MITLGVSMDKDEVGFDVCLTQKPEPAFHGAAPVPEASWIYGLDCDARAQVKAYPLKKARQG